jgi:parallel beta-helix repeat protein
MFLIAIGGDTAAGRIIYVDHDGTAEFDNIQAAIDDSNDGDTILVADGIYTGDGNRDIEFLGKAITLRSENGPERCIIYCQGSEDQPHRGFYFHNGEDSNSVLDGFTIRNGYQVSGGGIRCYMASPTIRNCIITNNRAEGGAGGGICYSHCWGATIDNCLITENLAEQGGGIISYGDNFSSLYEIIVSNCTLSANSARKGGAVFVDDSGNLRMVNCILWGDTALYGPEIAMGFFEWVSKLHIGFSNVQGGEAAVYDRVFLYWGPGNIDADPCFADPCNADYHLQSQAGRWDPNSETWVIDANTSPCIDAGNPGCPVGNEPEPNGNRRNMGAYGGTAEASKSPANWRSIADLTNDWAVDFNDLKVFVDYWLETGQCIPSDLNRSQSVDFADFALMAFRWLEER